ncbi:Twin-arginine translocation protein TatC [Streptococcus sp. DD12]|nr:Twin-arginine translocation protein TatC [Streptococcus sp. DD12]
MVICFFLAFGLSFIFCADIYHFLTRGFQQKLIVLGPNDILGIYISLASLMAFVVTLPFTVYQIWAFVRPALEKSEARAIILYVPATFACFVSGLLFGYFLITPAILRVLLSLGQGLFELQLTAENYLAFVLHTTVPVACLFELPVLISFLTSIGLVTPRWLNHYRRYAYFILLVLAVVLTPADFISDIAMTVPLILLYELSVLLSYTITKRKERKSSHGNLT